MKFKRLLVILFMLLYGLSMGQSLQEKLNRKVTLSYNDTPLKVLLRIMSKNYNFDYVIGEIGNERVSAKLVNVPLKQALNAVLLPQGYHYFVQDSVIVIKQLGASPSDELESFVYKCRYKSGTYLANYIKPILSDQGRIVALEDIQKQMQQEQAKEIQLQPNQQIILIKDIHNRLEDVKKVLDKVDVPEKQILIEVKLIERLIGNDTQAGLNWPTKVGVQSRSFPPKDQQALGGGSSGNQEQFTGWFKDLPSVSDNFQWGVITVEQLNAFLQLLGAENKSKIVSNPKITAQNNKPALVNIGTTVPIRTIQRSAQGDIITYEERQVSSFIEVLPIINEDNSLSLTIHPKMQEITGYVGEGDAPVPIIATRELVTNVKLKDGESLVIGGLIKETESKVVNKVFLLGDIPLLGYLFKHTAIKKEKSDLVIIVTPKILEN